MAEDYNSPQSPYWCLKTLIAICLAKDDAFWTEKELPYPETFFHPVLVPAPRQILCNHPNGNHHFLINPAQFVAWPMKASQAKYCKFEYSSSFTFSVPTGPLIQQIAPDCTLALSRDGAETWAVKWKCDEARFSEAIAHTPSGTSSLLVASVKWYPWGDRQVEVETTLIPPCDRWPSWHIRVHRITVHAPLASLHTVEGGFATPGRRTKDGTKLQQLDSIGWEAGPGTTEGFIKADDKVLILSKSGCSGIASLEIKGSRQHTLDIATEAMMPDSNTNLAHSRTLIPVLKRNIARDLAAGDSLIFTTCVFAVSATANSGVGQKGLDICRRWEDRPFIRLTDETSGGNGSYIQLGV